MKEYVGVEVITNDASGKQVPARQIFPAETAILIILQDGTKAAMFQGETTPSKVESIVLFDSFKDAFKWFNDPTFLQKNP